MRAFVDLHESVEFRREHQWWRMAEIHKPKVPARTDFAVQHGRDFARIVILIPSQSVACGD